MGKVSSQPQPTINHFSHPHPLCLSNLMPNSHANLSQTSCSACKLNLSPAGLMVYTCKPCNYNLHIDCAQMPQQINHQSHQQHTLSLVPKPTYPDGIFICDACGKHGNGFSYHCGPCGFDLHIKCAQMPFKVSHHSHHHGLQLTFVNPYGNGVFSCDVCKNVGSKEWIYRCNPCGFDCHLNCATTTVPTGQIPGTQLPAERPTLVESAQGAYERNYNMYLNQIMQGIASSNAEKNAVLNQMMQATASSNASQNAALNQIMQATAASQNALINQMIMQGTASSNATQNAVLNQIAQSTNASQNAVLNQMMQGTAASNNTIASTNATFDQIMQGIANNQSNASLQTMQLLAQGGFGGVANQMQGMMGGGGGGGGGANLLQGMMGGGSGGSGAGNIVQTLMGVAGGGDSLSGVLNILSGLGGLG